MAARTFLACVALAAFGAPATALPQSHAHHGAATAPDTRQLVPFPEALRVQTLANMRDHLLALQEINAALSRGEFDKAATVAEERLGMTSLRAHGATHVAPHMPQAMQDIGTAMHHAASRFAIDAQNAGATNDVKAALAALGPVMQQCAACHATYRLQ